MTKEEAIHILDNLNPTNTESSFDGYVVGKAITIAIKALEQEQYYKDLAESYEKTITKLTKAIAEQDPCEDAVNRAEIIHELNRLGRNAFKDDTDYDNFFAFVDSLPSVTPQEKITNQKYIATLTPAEFWKKIRWLQKEYGKRYNDSYTAIIEWLSAERSDDK